MNKYEVIQYNATVSPGFNPIIESNAFPSVLLKIVPNQNIIAGNFTIDGKRGQAIGTPGFVRHNSVTFFEEPASNIYSFKNPIAYDLNGIATGFEAFDNNHHIEEIILTEIYNQTSNFPMYIKVQVIFTSNFGVLGNTTLDLDFDYKE
mgnify:CR=1 FL=1|tara:strand:- start:297 stop:740 length:444 start_codon:yes stop_codon:yes gene_type:complete